MRLSQARRPRHFRAPGIPGARIAPIEPSSACPSPPEDGPGDGRISNPLRSPVISWSPSLPVARRRGALGVSGRSAPGRSGYGHARSWTLPPDAALLLDLDFDVFADAAMPAAYFPHGEGLTLSEGTALLTTILTDPRVRLVEVSEYATLRNLDRRRVGELTDALVGRSRAEAVSPPRRRRIRGSSAALCGADFRYCWSVSRLRVACRAVGRQRQAPSRPPRLSRTFEGRSRALPGVWRTCPSSSPRSRRRCSRGRMTSSTERASSALAV
jgi:hypothetical protein